MLKVTRVKGTGQFKAYIGNGFIGSSEKGSSPEDALHNLKRRCGEIYRPYVQEVSDRLNAWKISYAQLAAGINTGTIIISPAPAL